MNFKLKITAIVFLLLISIFIFYLVKKDKISIKYSFVWFIPGLLLLLFIILPKLLFLFTNIMGFQTASNMIFALLIAYIIVIIICLTIIVSKQKKYIRTLIQEISLLKNEIYKTKK